ncbi:hypothetical protein [Candidatus Magnetaquicoccus inordinatus]|uniref:hypothetical protein n=1 Tax=Candidatus Magnetaquicoccus inordinatus TaxID=2496818 RepID=UPI00102AF6C5|nr:hypothetical protein [Candidatus Magnetaquicoccus inordinatus]
MKHLKLILIICALSLGVLVSQQLMAAPPGQWNYGGYTQWHPNDGQTPMGTIGTQCFFCKPDPGMQNKDTANTVAPMPAPQQPVPYNYDRGSSVKKKPTAAMKKPAKKSAKKQAVMNKASKKKVAHKSKAQKKAKHKKSVKNNNRYAG